jgi:hypothetical protein
VSRTVNLALASVTAFFLLLPLTLGKPGLPPHLKADEAAYYLASLSLAHDRDLRVEVKDVDRAFQEFPYGPVNNLIVMTDDGWRTVYFGKPYIYSLLAAPFAALAGANGLVFFNMLLTMAMVWMGYLYLRRYNSEGLAALFAASFFLLSVGFSYVFWLQAEVLNMAAVEACLFFGLPRPEAGEPDNRRESLYAFLSGAALVLAVYNKPMFGAVGLAPLWAYARQRRWKTVGAWVLGAAVCLAAVAGLATLLTGHPSAYLGVQRQGVTLCEPGKVPIGPAVSGPVEPRGATRNAAPTARGVAVPNSTTGNTWTWLFRAPDITFYELCENIYYFLLGRHAGMLVYTPFAGLALVFFLLHGRRSPERWVLLGTVSAVALYFLVFIAWNWQGGGGFVGNRYFITAIPAFLFLVTEIRPRGLILLGHAAAGLFLAPLLFTPFGAIVPEPTLQSHVRNAPFRFLPLELSLRNVPGYERVQLGDLRIVGRKDVFLPQGEQMWVGGANRVELYFIGSRPIATAVFQVSNFAPGNHVEIEMGNAREAMDFGGAEEARRIRLQPGEPFRVRRQKWATFYVYRMIVTSRSGRIQHWVREYPPNACPYFAQDARTNENFYVGASLSYLGAGELLEADLYNVQWGSSLAPAQARAGAAFNVLTRVFNRSRFPWKAEGAARVNLSYHWLDLAGNTVVKEGLRTPIPLPVPPGGRVSVQQKVVAPAAPGRYILELDPVFETVAWFSERNGGRTFRVPVEVLPQEGDGVR